MKFSCPEQHLILIQTIFIITILVVPKELLKYTIPFFIGINIIIMFYYIIKAIKKAYELYFKKDQ